MEYPTQDFEFWARMDFRPMEEMEWDRLLMTSRPMKKHPTLRQCYHSCIVKRDETIRDEMVDWHNVYCAFHHCNQLIGPSWNGLQCGCDEYSHDLATKTLAILNDRIEERRKNREEEAHWQAEFEAKQIEKWKKKKTQKKVTVKKQPPLKKKSAKKKAKKKK